MWRIHMAALISGLGLAATSPAFAQSEGQGAVYVQPYIEVSQLLTAELSPGDDVLTFTQIAAGLDLNAQGRNSGASVSVRYERNIGYGDVADSDTISGVARGYISVIPQAVTFEAGALASRTRLDGGGSIATNPFVSDNSTSEFYGVYAGPSLATNIGPVNIAGLAQVGYNRFESDSGTADIDGNPVDFFDDSVTYNGQISASTRAGSVLPVGLSASAAVFQEDISNLDQRVRDIYARVDVTVPLTPSLAVVGAVGYENTEVSSRDAVRDDLGNPVFGDDGRLITDPSSPRIVAFDVDGFLWDVGVLWRPSSRTSLGAYVGRRYDSTTYYGDFTYAPSSRNALAVSVYDGISGLGGPQNAALSGLSSDFTAFRNPVTGDFDGLVAGEDGSGLINSLGSIRSAAFRNRGVNVTYQHQIGRLTAALGAGYNRRTFIAAEGTALEDIDGLTDESYFITGGLARDFGTNASAQLNSYISWFDAGTPNGDLNAMGISASYSQLIANRLSARAAVALDYFDSDFSAEDFATASALLGLRYDF